MLSCVVFLFLVSCSSSANLVKKEKPRDGRSYRGAVIVQSIQDEYDFVNSVCTDCILKDQQLTMHKNKLYDVVKYNTSSGKRLIYYFDVSQIVGK